MYQLLSGTSTAEEPDISVRSIRAGKFNIGK
jgi:hypothetical protein